MFYASNLNKLCRGIGVITYMLLSGDAPFRGACKGEDLMEVRNNILSGAVSFEESCWGLVSEAAIDFIKTLVSAPVLSINIVGRTSSLLSLLENNYQAGQQSYQTRCLHHLLLCLSNSVSLC